MAEMILQFIWNMVGFWVVFLACFLFVSSAPCMLAITKAKKVFPSQNLSLLKKASLLPLFSQHLLGFYCMLVQKQIK